MLSDSSSSSMYDVCREPPELFDRAFSFIGMCGSFNDDRYPDGAPTSPLVTGVGSYS